MTLAQQTESINIVSLFKEDFKTHRLPAFIFYSLPWLYKNFNVLDWFDEHNAATCKKPRVAEAAFSDLFYTTFELGLSQHKRDYLTIFKQPLWAILNHLNQANGHAVELWENSHSCSRKVN